MATLDELVVKLKLENKQLKRALDDSKRQMSKLERQTKKTASAFKLLSRVAVGAVAIKLAKDFLKSADTMRLLETRVINMSASAEQGAFAFDALRDQAFRLGVDLKTTIQVFQRATFAAKALGASQQDILQLTDTVQKLGVVSGASGEELKFGLRQFGQALSSGIVRAEEFNSIMENLPLLAEKIAEQFGKTGGEFRAMVADGEIASKDMAQAVGQIKDFADEEFRKLPVTLDRAFNSMTIGLDELSASIASNSTILEDLSTILMETGHFARELAGAFREIQAESNFQSRIATKLPKAMAEEYRKVTEQIKELEQQRSRIQDIAHPIALGLEELMGEGSPEERIKALNKQLVALETTRRKLEREAAKIKGEPEEEVNIIKPTGKGTGDKAIKEAQRARKKLQREIEAMQRSTLTKEEELKDAIAKVHEARREGIIKTKEEQDKLIEDLRKQYDELGHKIADSFDTALDRMVDGTGDFTDVITDFFREMSRDIIKDSLKPLKDAFREAITGKQGAGGGMLGGIFDSVGSGIGSFFGDLLSFDGGGDTGTGSRSGGIDGKGGFPAILHPNETVIDRTKGQSMGGGASFVQNNYNEFTSDMDIDRRIKAQQPVIARQTADLVLARLQEGGEFSKVVGNRL